MKKLIIGVLIYLSGCVAAYKLCKYDYTEGHPHLTWTVGSRNFVLFFSLGSWASFAGVSLCRLIDATNSDAPATW